MQERIGFQCFLLVSIISVLLVCGISQVESSEGEEGFAWGIGRKPDSDNQAALFGINYLKSHMKALPIQPRNENDFDQINILGKLAPPFQPVEASEQRIPKMVQFSLLELPTLTEIANVTRAGIFEPNRPDIQDMVEPIDINDPSCMGRGVLFSLFRSKNRGTDGKSTGVVSIGTAFLVSPQCIITAAHNVVLNNIMRGTFPHLNFFAERVEFWPLMNGFTPDMFQYGKLIDGGIRASSVKVPEEWYDLQRNHREHDIAVLKLNENIGMIYGYVEPTTADVSLLAKPTIISGYPVAESDERSTSCIILKCKGSIRKVDRHKAYYSIDPLTRKGHSGSPIELSTVQQIPPKVVGTHTTGSAGSDLSGGVIFTREKFNLLGQWVTDFEND